MDISSAVFSYSAPDLASCPDESLPEFAFIGRSNVGKSSLLNIIAGKHGLARVSATPGFTKLINMFTMNKTWRLVDLPGYGWAHVARQDKAKFNEAVAHYLRERPNLCLVFSLVDSSLPPQAMDLEFVEWLAENSIPFVLVFTKTDKAKPPEVQANIAAFKERISEWCEHLPEIFSCSSVAKHGRKELLAVIGLAIKDYQLQEAAEPKASLPQEEFEIERQAPIGQPKAPGKPERRPTKLTRPW